MMGTGEESKFIMDTWANEYINLFNNLINTYNIMCTYRNSSGNNDHL